jgi:hypothetical protein
MARRPPALVQAESSRRLDLRSALIKAGFLAAGIVLLQALLVMWFAWPAKNTAPRDLPVVVAGPPPAAAAVADRLRAERPGAFDISTVADAASADEALRDRDAYAAFVVDPAGLSLHVASAASPTVSTLLTQAVQQLGGGRPVPVVDVVSSPADDPRGAAFSSAFLPLLLTSLAAGVALLYVVRSHAVRLVGLLTFAALAGVVAAGIMHGLGVLTGSYLAAAGTIALLALAISGTVSGLGALIGAPGIGLGALVVFFVGNPISGLAAAPELLPKPWGTVGQFLPPGAGASLLRSAAFFDGAGATRPLWVLASWAVGGVLLTAVGHYRDRAKASVPETDAARDSVRRLGATVSA